MVKKYPANRIYGYRRIKLSRILITYTVLFGLVWFVVGGEQFLKYHLELGRWLHISNYTDTHHWKIRLIALWVLWGFIINIIYRLWHALD